MDLNQRIKAAIQAIDETTTLFYQQKQQEGYQELNTTLSKLMEAIGDISAVQKNGQQINIDQNRLNFVLGNAMQAIENGDTILLSDILVFELRQMLEDISN